MIMAQWVETNVNGHNVYTYDGNNWVSINKTYAYWGAEPVVNEWYAFSGTTLIGLTAKLENNAPVYEPTYGYGQSSYIIPNTVTQINEAPFIRYFDKGGSTQIHLGVSNTSATDIYIPDGVSFYLPQNGGVFTYCTALTKVRLPNDFTGNTSTNNDPLGAGTLFPYCTSLQEVTLPDSMTVLANTMFYGCSSFRRLNIIHNTLNRKMIVRPYAFNGSNVQSGGLEIYFNCSQTEAENMFDFDGSMGEAYQVIQSATKYYNQTIIN